MEKVHDMVQQFFPPTDRLMMGQMIYINDERSLPALLEALTIFSSTAYFTKRA